MDGRSSCTEAFGVGARELGAQLLDRAGGSTSIGSGLDKDGEGAIVLYPSDRSGSGSSAGKEGEDGSDCDCGELHGC